MVEKLINYIKNDDYLIGMYDKYIYIYNYNELINVTSTYAEIKFKNKLVKIRGEKIFIKKLENKELLIEGIFKEIDLDA